MVSTELVQASYNPIQPEASRLPSRKKLPKYLYLFYRLYGRKMREKTPTDYVVL